VTILNKLISGFTFLRDGQTGKGVCWSWLQVVALNTYLENLASQKAEEAWVMVDVAQTGNSITA